MVIATLGQCRFAVDGQNWTVVGPPKIEMRHRSVRRSHGDLLLSFEKKAHERFRIEFHGPIENHPYGPFFAVLDD